MLRPSIARSTAVEVTPVNSFSALPEFEVRKKEADSLPSPYGRTPRDMTLMRAGLPAAQAPEPVHGVVTARADEVPDRDQCLGPAVHQYQARSVPGGLARVQRTGQRVGELAVGRADVH